MGQTSAKFAPEMADKNKNQTQDGQNSIETAEIGEAEDARDSAKGIAATASHRSPRSAEEAQPAGARALWRAQWQAQRRVSLGGDEGNRMRDKLPRIRVLTH
jgi:hypothetical protein